jgi:hypothetical protein
VLGIAIFAAGRIRENTKSILAMECTLLGEGNVIDDAKERATEILVQTH